MNALMRKCLNSVIVLLEIVKLINCKTELEASNLKINAFDFMLLPFAFSLLKDGKVNEFLRKNFV